MAHHFTAGQASLWVQLNGPGTQPLYLGCHEIGDIDEPEGDITPFTCPDPSGVDRFIVVGSTQGAPGAVTAQLTADVTDELDYLEKLKCAATIFVHKVQSGRRDVFGNYRRMFILRNARVTNRGLTNMAVRDQDNNDRSSQTFSMSAEALLRPMRLTIARQSVSETGNINDISFCGDESCRTSDTAAQASCQTGYAACSAPSGSPTATANVLKTTDGGTWAATTSDPFAAGEAAISVECLELGSNSNRVIVARGTADAGAPAEVAYSDDGGDNWTAANVGSVNGQYAPTRFSLFALDRNNIWFGTQNGYIYKSIDAGVSWVAQESAVIQAGAWNAIHFVDENVGWAVGASNIIARTVDGGSTWSVITSPASESGNNALCVFAQDRNRMQVGYDSGTAYSTFDAGGEWASMSFSGSGVGEVRAIAYYDELVGYLFRNNTSTVGSVLFTVDGGYSWEEASDVPTNLGFNGAFICDLHKVFFTGNVQGGTGFIGKGSV